MRTLMKALSLFMLLVTLVGIVVVAISVVGGYMVGSGQVQPGDPIYLDELAPSLSEALSQGVIGIGLITLAFWVRSVISRKLAISHEP